MRENFIEVNFDDGYIQDDYFELNSEQIAAFGQHSGQPDNSLYGHTPEFLSDALYWQGHLTVCSDLRHPPDLPI